MWKVVHVITGLSTGGAEGMLYKLLTGLDSSRFASEVVSLTDIGAIGMRIRDLGIRVSALGMRRGAPNPVALLRLVKVLRRDRPDLMQTWMYHADLIGGIAAKLAGDIPVIWGVRQSDFDPATSRPTTMLTARVCARLSAKVPRAILCCSEAASRIHAALGYQLVKLRVIPNGFDLANFEPDAGKRMALREKIGVRKDVPLVGLVARFDPMKDHRTFIEAAARVNKFIPDVRFVMYGEEITPHNKTVMSWIQSKGLEEACSLLGRHDNMAEVYPALDMLVLSSAYGEGFPNVLGEAMASGVPCIATDVGDSARIIGDTGVVVPPRDPQALADAIRRIVDMGNAKRFELGAAARRRVAQEFSLESVVKRYANLYEEVLNFRTPSKCVG
jgi:glycosyltransferase involved in cell wall biosynthesis